MIINPFIQLLRVPLTMLDEENHVDVKINLLLHKQHNRKYPPLKEGDQVKIYKKKDKKHQKEHYSVWSQHSYKIDDEIISMGQTFYKIAGFPKMYMRHELLKVELDVK